MSKKQLQSAPKSKKKEKRAKRTDIGFINEYGLEITFEEQEEYRQLVNRAKRKSKNIQSKWGLSSYSSFAKPFNNFSTSISSYKSRKEFEFVKQSLANFSSRDSLKDYSQTAKENIFNILDTMGVNPETTKLQDSSFNVNEVLSIKEVIDKKLSPKQLILLQDKSNQFLEAVYEGDIDGVNEVLESIGYHTSIILNNR